jgi:hypothetical protein
MEFANNGMITKIWGEAGWLFNHTVTFGYPINPTPEQKTAYLHYFTLLGDVLPCCHCRKSYKEFILKGETKLDETVMENRETLTRWFYNIHQAVNAKLNVDYGITYQDVVDKYESFRAKCDSNMNATGCLVPSNYKAFSFFNLKQKDAPIIPVYLASRFIGLAIKRGFTEKHLEFIKSMTKIIDMNKLRGMYVKREDGSETTLWNVRNHYCITVIDYMRINSIDSIEKEGNWAGYPTMEELKLILMLSSNIPINELQNLADKFNLIYHN